jgi:hypothetical protein
MFTSIGTLIYSNNPYKLIVEVDDEIGKFYRSLIPKYLNVQRPMYPTHISTVRNETPPNLSVWGKYQNKEIEFEYDNYIYSGEVYYWLNAYSSHLEDIRLELGLSNTSPYTRSPDGRHRFHMTLANLKHTK